MEISFEVNIVQKQADRCVISDGLSYFISAIP